MKKKITNIAIAAVLAIACRIDPSNADSYSCDNPPPCRKFSEIYADGKELCENMWDDAFAYEEDEDKGFTMWFHGDNPNTETADSLDSLAHISATHRNDCHLEYYHHDTPTTGNNFAECAPWNDKACCASETVRSANALREGYGAEYHWDRCGPLSPACERFFVEEACFYECEPAAGHFRKHPKDLAAAALDGHRDAAYRAECDPDAEGYNAEEECYNAGWQMYKMPIKASYCDAWHHACADDSFCGSDGGSYFSCAAQYQACDHQQAAETKLEEELAATKAALVVKAELAAALAAELELEQESSGDAVDADADGGLDATPRSRVGLWVMGCVALAGMGAAWAVAYGQGKKEGVRLLAEDPSDVTGNPTFNGL